MIVISLPRSFKLKRALLVRKIGFRHFQVRQFPVLLFFGAARECRRLAGEEAVLRRTTLDDV